MFGSDDLDKSCGKIKGNSVRVINNVVDRVRLAPELAGIVRTAMSIHLLHKLQSKGCRLVS
jgi:hypothetical protein